MRLRLRLRGLRLRLRGWGKVIVSDYLTVFDYRMLPDGIDNWFEHEQLHFAAQDGDVPRMKDLLAQGYSIDVFDELGKTPLHYAVEKGHEDAVLLLIKAGANVNAHDERMIGNTPLGEVAGNCSLRMAQMLITAGADPTIPGWMQLTALDRAKGRKQGDGPQVYALMVKTAELG